MNLEHEEVIPMKFVHQELEEGYMDEQQPDDENDKSVKQSIALRITTLRKKRGRPKKNDVIITDDDNGNIYTTYHKLQLFNLHHISTKNICYFSEY